MNKQVVLVVIVCALLTASCSRMPMPAAKNHAYSEQYIMQAAHHWDVLAGHVAEKLNGKLNAEMSSLQPTTIAVPITPSIPVAPPVTHFTPPPVGDGGFQPQSITPLHLYQGVNGQYQQPAVYGAQASGNFQPVTAAPGGYTTPAPQMANPGFITAATIAPSVPPLYVPAPPTTASPFTKSFYHLLRSQLLKNDLSVVDSPDGPYGNCFSAGGACRALKVSYDVEVVNHKGRGGPMRYPGRLTSTLLAGGATAWIIKEATNNADKTLAVLPLLVYGEMMAAKRFYWPDETNTEVVVSVSVNDGNLVLFNDTSIYYVNAGDQDHYAKTSKSYRVVNQ